MGCFAAKSLICTTLRERGWRTPAVHSWSFPGANIPTKAHSLWAMCHSYYVLAGMCCHIVANHTRESTQLTNWLHVFSDWSISFANNRFQFFKVNYFSLVIKNPFLHKRRKYYNALVDINPGSPSCKQYIFLPNIMNYLHLQHHMLNPDVPPFHTQQLSALKK